MRRQAFGERNPQVGPDRFYNERMVHGNNRDVPQSEGTRYNQQQRAYGGGDNGRGAPADRHTSSSLSSFGDLHIGDSWTNLATRGPRGGQRDNRGGGDSWGNSRPADERDFRAPTPPLPPPPLFPQRQQQQPQRAGMASGGDNYNDSFQRQQQPATTGSNGFNDHGYDPYQRQRPPQANNHDFYNVRQSAPPPAHSSSMPHLAHGNMMGGYQQAQTGPYQSMQQLDAPRRRRQKYIPPTKPDVELFNERNHIKAGDFWEEMFGEDNDNFLTVSCMDGNESQTKQLIQQFDECGFSEQIMRNILLRRFKAPTQIQKSVIPVIRKRKSDLMAHAQTGSGKTAAFMLPIIAELQALKTQTGTRGVPNSDSPFALMIVPSKELAEQMYKEGRTFAINTGVSVQRTYGDMYMRESKQLLQSGCDVCIVTCGRLLHFLRDGLIKLRNLRFLVLDEADKLLTCEHFHQCIQEVKQHPEMNPAHRVLMFSATYGAVVQGMAQNILRPGYVFIKIGLLNSAVSLIKQEFLEVGKFDKQDKLLEILKKDAIWRSLPGGNHYWKPAKKTLVFVGQKRQSDRLAIGLIQQKFRTTNLNSDRTLEQRSRAVSEFTLGAQDVLVSTDVAARGLNFPNVDHVINFDLPERDEEKHTYIHRIGRTGRAGNKGQATSFFDPRNPEDLTKASFYIEVLEQTQNQVPPFLRKWADESRPDFMMSSAPLLDDVDPAFNTQSNQQYQQQHHNHRSPWDEDQQQQQHETGRGRDQQGGRGGGAGMPTTTRRTSATNDFWSVADESDSDTF